MLTSRVLLVPHWPTLLVDEHRGHRTPMLEALAAQAAQLSAEAPAAIVVLSGRWDSEGPFRVDVGRRHRTLTDYSGLGVEIRYDCTGAPALARALVEAGVASGVRVGAAERGVDSGVTVPLHFLVPRPVVPIVPLSTAPRTPQECRAWGAVVRRVLAAREERVTFVVGGALSGSMHDWSLRREVPQARDLDERVLRALSSGAWDELAGIPRAIVERAHPEAGLRHLEVLRGFLGDDLAGRVICHEAGPGIGGALVQFDLPVGPGVAPPAPAPAPVVHVSRAMPRAARPARQGSAPHPARKGSAPWPARRTGPPRPGTGRTGAPRAGRTGPPRPGAGRTSGPPRTGRTGPPRPGTGRPGAPRTGRTGPPRPGAGRTGSQRPATGRTRPPRPGAGRTGAPRPSAGRSGPPRPGASRSGPPRPGARRGGPAGGRPLRPSGRPASSRPGSRPPARGPRRPTRGH